MLYALRKLVAATVAFMAMGCRGKVPDDHTSLVRPVGANPGRLSKPLSMVWLHHSTGDALLQGGLLEALKADGVMFYDINYGEAVVDGYVIGDHTDIPDWPKTFNTPALFDVVKSWELRDPKAHHNIVMFKSCYPNSNITTDATLEQNKQHFNALLQTFQANPDVLFIGMSTPPLVKADTTPEAAKRARQLAEWLSTEFARDTKNVKVFDLFDALAVLSDKPDGNTLVPQFSSGRKDSHPSPEGARAVTRLFIPWFNRAVREAGFAQ